MVIGFRVVQFSGSGARNFKYLLLTEFEVRTVSYGPNFSLLIYGAGAKRAGHESTGKNENPDRENEVIKIFIISLRLMGHALSNLAGCAVECGPQS